MPVSERHRSVPVSERHRSVPVSERRRVAPFAVVTGVGLLTLLFPPYVDELSHLLTATALLALVVFVGFKAPRDSWWAAVPPMLFFLVVMVLRDGSGGAPSTARARRCGWQRPPPL